MPAKKTAKKKPARPHPKRPAKKARAKSGPALVAQYSEAKIIQLEADLAEEKRAHEETKAKLAEALENLKPHASSAVKKAKAEVWANGKDPQDHERGPVKLGFIRVDGVAVPFEEERKLVAIMLKLRALVGNKAAAERLNAKGVVLRGKPWTPSKITWAAAQAAAWVAPE